MAVIAPFKGLTYNFKLLADMSRLVAPPYDVITEDEQEKYYQTDPYNVVRLILGKKKRGDSDWDNRYTRAVDDLKRWESEDTLVRSDFPSMYITSMAYEPGEGSGLRVRWGLIVLVRIEEEGSGIILPHERTFSAHRNDRLKLMRACNAQLSQVFGLYEDPENKVFSYFKKSISGPPVISFDFKDGTSHQMWVVQDESFFKRVAYAMYDKPIFIADGHHRYETSRNYRNVMRARYGTRPENRSYEFVMMYLTNMDDIGLTILPSHRLIKKRTSFQLEPFFQGLLDWFDITEIPFSDAERSHRSLSLKKMLEEKGLTTSVIGFHHHRNEKCYLLALKHGARDEMGEDLAPPLKKLDVLVLSRFILQRSLGFTKEDLDDDKIFHFESDTTKAISLVDSGLYQMAFLLNPTRIHHVKEVASSSLIMPRKSTYFYPKVLSGLVFNKINPREIVEVF